MINRLYNISFLKVMQQENKDSRCRLGSDNITADEVFTESELASMEFKYTV